MKPSVPSSELSPGGGRRFLHACLLLTTLWLLTGPLVAWYGHAQHGADGILAALTAGGVCWLGALLALIFTRLLSGSQAVQGLMLSMLFRMGLPLAAGALLTLAGGPLAKAGVLGMILLYYLVFLVAETLLSVWLLGGWQVKAS